MCGLVGFIGTRTFTDRMTRSKLLSELLYADTFRGEDSTGLAAARFDQEHVPVYKRALPAPDFLQMRKTDKLLSNIDDYNVVMGHNRAATKGSITDQTAHPFQFKHITLAHNGTVSNHRTLTGGDKFVVDSEAIANAVAEAGIEHVVKTLDGSFALTYIDKSNNTFNIIRNDERPLALAKIKMQANATANFWFYASEQKMLEWIIYRNKFVVEEMYLPKPGQLFTFDLENTSKFSLRELTLKKPQAPAESRWGAQSFRSPQQHQTKQTGKQDTPALCLPHSNLKDAQQLRQERNLQALGLGKGSEIDFVACEWHPYKSDPSNGYMTGYMMDDGWHEIKVFNIHEIFWAWLQNLEENGDSITLRGKAVSAYLDDKSPNVGTVIVDNVARVEDINEKKKDEDVLDAPPFDSGKSEDDGNECEAEEILVEGPNGNLITSKEFKERTKCGCGWCSEQVSLNDAPEILWTNGGFVCPDCIEQFHSSHSTNDDHFYNGC
jgi:predicted glutamine amidotransferase